MSAPLCAQVMRATSAVDEYELQLVAAQDGLAHPSEWFEARTLPPN